MTKTKSTKRALLMSMLSMLLCIAMLVGSTFAWFTDSVTSGNNKILAGNLDVELEYTTASESEAEDGLSTATWHEVNNDTDSLFAKEALWEPGYTEVVYLRVKNAGTLALKYKLGINVANKVIGKTADDKDIDLANFIEFGVAKADTPFTDRSTAREAVKADAVKLSAGYASESETTLDKEETSDPFALVVYMPEDVGNDANYGTGKTKPEITLGINLVATQATVEEDSFDNLYDKDATYPEVATGTSTWYDETAGDPSEPDTYTLTSASELAGLAKLVNEGKETFEGKTITLASDIALDGVSNWIPIGSAEHPFNGTFDGAGHTVSGLYIDHNLTTTTGLDIIGFFGTIENATIKDLTVDGNITITDTSKIIEGDEFTVGGICGMATASIISGCTNEVTIDVSAVTEPATICVGGILGIARDKSGGTTTTYLTKCVNNADLTAAYSGDFLYTTLVGGITGCTRLLKVNISDCENHGELIGEATDDMGVTF